MVIKVMTHTVAEKLTPFLAMRFKALEGYELPGDRIVKLFDVDHLTKVNGVLSLPQAINLFPIPLSAFAELEGIVYRHISHFRRLIKLLEFSNINLQYFQLSDLDTPTGDFSRWWLRYSNDINAFLNSSDIEPETSNLKYFLEVLGFEDTPAIRTAFTNAYIGGLGQLCTIYMMHHNPFAAAYDVDNCNVIFSLLFVTLGNQTRQKTLDPASSPNPLPIKRSKSLTDLVAAPQPQQAIEKDNIVAAYVNSHCRTAEYGILIEVLKALDFSKISPDVFRWWGEEVYQFVEYLHAQEITDRGSITAITEQFISKIVEMVPQEKLGQLQKLQIEEKLLTPLTSLDGKENVAQRVLMTNELLTEKLKDFRSIAGECTVKLSTYQQLPQPNFIDACILRASITTQIKAVENNTPIWKQILSSLQEAFANLFSLSVPSKNITQQFKEAFAPSPIPSAARPAMAAA